MTKTAITSDKLKSRPIKLTELIYVASPYSPTTKLGKLPIIRTIIKCYRNYLITKIIGLFQNDWQFAFIGPITQSHQTGKYVVKNDGGFTRWRTIDLTYISHCDAIWVVQMNGWKESIGVQAEIKFAKSRGIPVLYVHPDTLNLSQVPFKL